MKFTISGWVVGCATFAFVSLPASSLAQAERALTVAEDGKSSVADRARERYNWLRSNGVTLKVGSILPGSSLSAGIEFGRDRILGTPVGATVGASSSIRGYHMYEARLGMMKGREHRAELGPVDSDLNSIFNDNSLIAPGKSIFVHARERVYPRMDFFGLGQSAAVGGRSDYGLAGSSVDLVGQWQGNRHFGVSARLGTLDLRLRPGTNRGVPDIDTVYTAAAAPSLDVQHRYRTVGAAATFDYRDAPNLTSEGTFLGIAWWRGSAADVDEPSLTWTRLVTEVRHFIPVGSPDRVVAVHGLFSTRLGEVTSPTPYYLQPTLGGTKTLRGFGSYRLRGDAAWATTVEYRWRLHRRLEVAPFLDAGAVADRLSHLGTVRMAVAPGIGFRAIAHSKVAGRLDFARGRDGNRLIFTVSAPF